MFAAHNSCYWNHERRMDGENVSCSSGVDTMKIETIQTFDV